MTAVWTNTGIDLVATAIQTPSGNAAITYVAIGTGAGTLASGLTSGTAYTTLTLDAGIPVALASSQSLTITDGTNSQTVTTSASVAQGLTNIPVASFTASFTFAAHTTGVAPTPAVTDTALYNETARVAATAGSAGASPGESLNTGYFDGSQDTAFYMQVGFYGGSTATATLGTGTLMIEDVQVWNHTINVESNIYEADTVI